MMISYNNAIVKTDVDIENKINYEGQKNMKLYIDFSEFHPWRGAVNTWEKIKEAGKIDMLEQVLTESYTDGMSNTELNDLLWFESEDLFNLLEIDETDNEDDDDFDSFCNHFSDCSYCPLVAMKEISDCMECFNNSKKGIVGVHWWNGWR